MGRNRKKKNSAFATLILMLIGGFVGLFAGKYLGKMIASTSLTNNFGLDIAIFAIVTIIVVYSQIIIHELGHMIFGLFTGYKFLSFRVGNITLIRKENGYKLASFSFPGTAGQCIMSPERLDDDMPFVLYNLGGGLFNLFAAAISLLFLNLFSNMHVILTIFLSETIFLGVFFAIINLFPLNFGISNDGYNIMTMIRNKKSRKYFFMQLKLMEYLTLDKRVRDIPNELIEMPSDSELNNVMGAANAVLYCGKLMDEQRFDEAKEKIDYLLESDFNIINVHREVIKADRIYLELISENPSMELVKELYDKDLKKMMKALKNNISTPRFNYAVELLYNENIEKAKLAISNFNKIKSKYPYAGEIESETELLEIAKNKYEETYINNIREHNDIY